MIIKAGILLSYDYKYLQICLPLIYNCKDLNEIVLALDENFTTWSGEKFTIPDEFFQWLKDFDTENKITLYKDSFYVKELSPMQCETRERRMIAEKMGSCDWYIQIDGDEYMPDFSGFVNRLKEISAQNSEERLLVTGKFVTLFKQTGRDVFIVTPVKEHCWLATNTPDYEYARVVKDYRHIATDFLVIHQSWARENAEIEQKIRNWGHKNDFDVEAFYQQWKRLSASTYTTFKNFHPLNPAEWKSLVKISGYTIEEFANLPENKIRNLLKYPFLRGVLKLLG